MPQLERRKRLTTGRLARDAGAVLVFLIRHAEAIDETLELRDPHRHLTDHGRAQARALGDRLRWHDCTPSVVWTSPLVRAVQTAELVLAVVGGAVPVRAEPALAPGADVRPLVQRLAAAGVTSVALVGHEPILSGIGSILSGRDDFAALAKAEAVRLDGLELGKGEGPRSAGKGGYRVRWRFAWNDVAPRTGA